jgi:hypothetical protein
LVRLTDDLQVGVQAADRDADRRVATRAGSMTVAGSVRVDDAVALAGRGQRLTLLLVDGRPVIAVVVPARSR